MSKRPVSRPVCAASANTKSRFCLSGTRLSNRLLSKSRQTTLLAYFAADRENSAVPQASSNTIFPSNFTRNCSTNFSTCVMARSFPPIGLRPLPPEGEASRFRVHVPPRPCLPLWGRCPSAHTGAIGASLPTGEAGVRRLTQGGCRWGLCREGFSLGQSIS